MGLLSKEAKEYLLRNGNVDTVLSILGIILETLIDLSYAEGGTVENGIMLRKIARALEYDMEMIANTREDSIYEYR